VFPCLLLNYFGQGALLLSTPGAVENPFFLMIPKSVSLVVVLLATAATVIASQALISGSYSLTMQAIRLSYLPRLSVRHTSVTEKGQIYVPAINWMLMVACILLVIGFGTSSDLAAAYGVGVNLDMLIATTMFFVLVMYRWDWPLWKALPICALLFVVEAAFMTANSAKILKGGWFPLVIGCTIFTLMTTWKQGRKILGERLQARTVPLRNLLARLDVDPLPRVPGTAIFLYGNRHGTPPALLSNLRHNKILHERIILLAVEFKDQPFVMRRDRLEVVTTGSGFYRIFMRFGYMDRMDVHAALRGALLDGQPLNLEEVSYFLGKETLIPLPEHRSGMPLWREQLFALLVRNATDATKFFFLPAEQVVELGTQVEI
jgi:KUP system potassium uptake protein